jgi:hypothetical protein
MCGYLIALQAALWFSENEGYSSHIDLIARTGQVSLWLHIYSHKKRVIRIKL